MESCSSDSTAQTGSLGQNPIDTTGTAEVRSGGSRSSMAVTEGIMELHATDDCRGWSLSKLKIEVTCQHHGHFVGALAGL